MIAELFVIGNQIVMPEIAPEDETGDILEQLDRTDDEMALLRTEIMECVVI